MPFYFGHIAYGILVPQLGTEPLPPVLEAWSLNHWTARKVPDGYSFKQLSCGIIDIEWAAFKVYNLQGFPGGSVVKHPLASVGDMGLIPSQGRSHMSWSNSAGEPQLLSLCSRVWEPQLLSPCTLEPMHPITHALKRENLLHEKPKLCNEK